MKRSIEKLRFEYGNTPLLEEDLKQDPFEQFASWLKEAVCAEVFEPNAMTLSTVSSLGRPSARMVLLKDFSSKGFTFYSYRSSRKAEQLEDFPYAAITFWWRDIFRQVCIEGKIAKVSHKEAHAYFKKRPRGAQLAAHASLQSTPLASRDEMEATFEELKKKFKGKEVPYPSNWQGYRLVPDRFEFWQGRADRLHDRFVYIYQDNNWIISRLYP